MSNNSLDLIDFNTSLSQQTPSEDTTLATFHHQPPPTPLPQKHNTPPQCKDVSEDNGEEGIPLTAAGLTRAMETNQGQSLTEIINISIANPSHLFWVPASQHPELAPTEFEKYVVALRANAKDKGKVKRRRSVLSQSFTAADSEMRSERNTSTPAFDEQQDGNDDDDDDDLRNGNSKEGERQFALGALENKHHQYNISLGRSNSLHSLGEIDDNNQHDLSEPGTNRQSTGKKDENQSQANKHATKARKERLRRSMSLHLPGNTDTGRIPDFLVFDRNSTALDQSPVLVPKTDRPLSRRGARTRFQRTSSIAPSTPKLNNSPPERQWPGYRHSDSIYSSSSSPPSAPTTPINGNNDNSSKENDSDNKVTNEYHSSSDLETKLQAQSDQSHQLPHLSDNPIVFEEPQSTLDIITPSTVHSSRQPAINNPQRTIGSLSRTESPNLDHDLSTTLHKLPSTSSINQRTPSEKSSTQQVAVKSPPRERKSSWSWSFWSDDKKSKAEQPLSTTTPTASSVPNSMSQTNHDIRQTKHDDGHNKTENIPLPMVTSASTPTSKQRFGFSSLFSRKNSSTTNASSSSPSGPNGGKLANGDNSTNSAVLTVPPKDFQLNRINHQHRLPIHVERAVYRLSHMKLANPRRPLHDQVIISNFMFWYLSLISEQQQNQSQHQSTPSAPQQQNSKNGRHSPPRTPQQIVSASKNKKKRLTKKSSHQNTVPPVPTLSSSASTSSSSVSSHQSKHSSSISQKASYEQYQQHHPLSSSPPSQQHHTQDKSWQHYIDGSSKQASTGFVIPENYLRPTSESNVSDNNGTNNKGDVGKQHQRQVRQYVRRNSSSSEDDDEDEDDDDDEYDDDDDYGNNYKDKNSKSFYTGSKSKQQKEKTAKQMSKHMKKQHYPTGQHHHHQHQPQQRLSSPILQSAPSSS